MRLVWRKVSETGQTLEQCLLAELADRDGNINSGTILTSSSGNGKSVGLALLSGHGPVEAKEIFGELLDLRDAVIERLGGSPTDEEVYAEMMNSLVQIREYGHDFSRIRGCYGDG